MGRPRAKSCGEDRDLLHLVWQRPDNVETGNGREFADLLNGNIRLTISAGLGRVPIIGLDLRTQLIGEAEPDELAGEVKPADFPGASARSIWRCATSR